MKKHILAILAAAVLAIAPTAKANTIPFGTFGFVPFGSVPTYTPIGGGLNSATSVTLSDLNVVNGPSVPATYLGQPNIFNGIAGNTITVSPLTLTVSHINGAPNTYGISNYLTWAFGGDTYSFALLTGTWTSSGSGALNFTGIGDFTDGNGAYSNQINQAAITYAFTQGSGTAVNYSATFEVPPAFVPEPSSLVLLGTGLLGAAIVLFWRKRTAHSEPVA